jgi:hypothetical protein
MATQQPMAIDGRGERMARGFALGGLSLLLVVLLISLPA